MDGNLTSYIAQKRNPYFLEAQEFLDNRITAEKEVHRREIPSHIRWSPMLSSNPISFHGTFICLLNEETGPNLFRKSV